MHFPCNLWHATSLVTLNFWSLINGTMLEPGSLEIGGVEKALTSPASAVWTCSFSPSSHKTTKKKNTWQAWKTALSLIVRRLVANTMFVEPQRRTLWWSRSSPPCHFISWCQPHLLWKIVSARKVIIIYCHSHLPADNHLLLNLAAAQMGHGTAAELW